MFLIFIFSKKTELLNNDVSKLNVCLNSFLNSQILIICKIEAYFLIYYKVASQDFI